MRMILALSSLFVVAACGSAETDPGPGGVTVGEARALDEAAEIIEERRLPEEATKPPADQGAPAQTDRNS